MPRVARLKSENSIMHVMIRSISEIQLFKEDDDKEKYLSLIKRYQMKLGFKVYGYCLLDNHGHLIIDSHGADISKIMHGINFCYAMYFNKKYERHGHVFQDRFKSKIVKDEKYLLTLSAYIHANPRDIVKYRDIPQRYEYSSLGIYLNTQKDYYDIIDKRFIMSIFSFSSEKAKRQYVEFVCGYMDNEIKLEEEFLLEGTEYVSGRVEHKRNYTPENIIEYVSEHTGIDKRKIFIKYNKEATTARAISAFLMRRFCNFAHKDISKVLGNITYSRISSLSSQGLEIILKEKTYEKIINDFIYKKVV